MSRTLTTVDDNREERRRERTAICNNCGGEFKPETKGQRFCDSDCEKASHLHISTRPGVPFGWASAG